MYMEGNSLFKKHLFKVIVFSSILFSILFFYRLYIPKTLKLVFLDVGQGDAVYIQTPLGKNILIDTGPPQEALSDRLYEVMDSFDRNFDLVIMTHPDIDHIGNMPKILKNYRVERIVYSGLDSGAELYEIVALGVQKQKIPIFTAHAGQRIVLEPGVYLDILSPHINMRSLESNDYSVVARLSYKNNSALLTGDATKYIESDIVGAYGDVITSDILKLGHHGSDTSTSDLFLDTVLPLYAIVSAGCDNRFGHPHTEVLVRVMKRNISLLDTCDHGNIIFETQGDNWKLISNKKHKE